MRFTGTLVRLGRALAVDGDVSRQPDGSWAGSLTFSRADAPTVAPGPATIKTDAGETWDVFISSTHTTMESLRGASAFQVIRGIA
jgi:hypothetical protein